MKLTAKQSLFCKEYLIDKNATQAAIRAGYSKHTANRIGPQNLSKVGIKSRIDEELAAQQDRTEVTADRVIAEIAKLAFIDIKRLYDENDNLIPISCLPNDVSAAISGVEVNVTRTHKASRKGVDGDEEDEDGCEESIHKIKLWDKKGALDLLARHFNLLGDGDKGLIPEGCYVQIYRPEKHTKEDMASASRTARGSV